MGQHKRNPIAILAKEGKLPPKPLMQTEAEYRRQLYSQIDQMILAPHILYRDGLSHLYSFSLLSR